MRPSSTVMGYAILLLTALAGCAPPVPEAREEPDPPQTLSGMLGHPEGWSATNLQSIELFTQGKTDESIAMLERFAAQHPRFPDVHFSLGDSHLLVAQRLDSNDRDQAEARKQHLEKAAIHFERTHALFEDPLDRAQATRLLVTVYAADNLNRLDRAEPLARRLLEELSGRVDGYEVLAGILRESGRHGEATALLQEGLAQAPAEQRRRFAEEMIDHVGESPAISSDDVRSLLEPALEIVEGQLRSSPDDAPLILIKANALRLQASRVEKDAGRRKAVADEAERLQDRGLKLLLANK